METAIIVLMGLRGSGKSTLGPTLAAERGWSFIDLDDVTARELGVGSAGEALTTRGESAFREAEVLALAGVLREARAGSGLVLALGGGTPMAPGATTLLLGPGRARRLVYLRASAATLVGRIAPGASSRPGLLGAGPTAEVEALLARRDPWYRAIADVIIDVDGLTPEGTMRRLRGA